MNGSFKTRFRQTFSKSFFNNKSQFNMFRSSSNSTTSKFTISFGNKFFMTRILHLKGSRTLSMMLKQSHLNCGNSFCLGTGDTGESASSGNPDINELILGYEGALTIEDNKWTCESVVHDPQLLQQCILVKI